MYAHQIVHWLVSQNNAMGFWHVLKVASKLRQQLVILCITKEPHLEVYISTAERRQLGGYFILLLTKNLEQFQTLWGTGTIKQCQLHMSYMGLFNWN